MADQMLGYNGLIHSKALLCRPDRSTSRISSRYAVKQIREFADGSREVIYPHQFAVEDTLPRHLEFCLKHEGVNLEVLKVLFEKTGPQPYADWLKSSPSSLYARRVSFFYEWLLDQKLPIPDVTAGHYTPAADPGQYYLPQGYRERRFRIINNLPGLPAFCPLVRRTPMLEAFIGKNLKGKITAALAGMDAEVLARAVDYLYLAETKSSYGIERETPTPERMRRFRRLLEVAGEDVTLDEDCFVGWQNEIMEPRRREASFRAIQNWLGKSGYRHRHRADYIPPAAEDAHLLMQGLAEYCRRAESGGIDSVIASACASFGFVFIHPFIDGNGRLHRFLLHHLLRRTGFTPPSALVPVSSVMYGDLGAYSEVLHTFSKPVMALLEYYLEENNAAITVTSRHPRDFYAYFDATRIVEYVYGAIEKAIEEDLPLEVAYLQCYDAAYNRINARYDMPGRELDLFIQVVVDNGGSLSISKRKSHFSLLTQEQIVEMESIISECFGPFFTKQRAS
ncbi:MAG: Fic family protein [Sulfurimicrobium sp.]|nr:Fic family protein [Sulfurimicrobium sp.]